MGEMTKVAVDAMGGDNAPAEIVKGAIEAVTENSRIKVYLTGRQDVIKNPRTASYTSALLTTSYGACIFSTDTPLSITFMPYSAMRCAIVPPPPASTFPSSEN